MQTRAESEFVTSLSHQHKGKQQNQTKKRRGFFSQSLLLLKVYKTKTKKEHAKNILNRFRYGFNPKLRGEKKETQRLNIFPSFQFSFNTQTHTISRACARLDFK